MCAQVARPPRIVVTLMTAANQQDPVIAARKNALYVDSVTRHGAAAIPLDATRPASERAAAFAVMDGLLITGGADIHPSRYGEPNEARRPWTMTGTSWSTPRGTQRFRAACRSWGSAAASRR